MSTSIAKKFANDAFVGWMFNPVRLWSVNSIIVAVVAM